MPCRRFFDRKLAKSNRFVATKALACKLSKAAWYVMSQGSISTLRELSRAEAEAQTQSSGKAQQRQATQQTELKRKTDLGRAREPFKGSGSKPCGTDWKRTLSRWKLKAQTRIFEGDSTVPRVSRGLDRAHKGPRAMVL